MPTANQIRDLFVYVQSALRRYWRLAGGVFAAIAVIAFVGALLMPKSYYSEARLFVRFGRENQVDLTATTGQMVSFSESRETEINSLIEILKSRATFDRVVEELGPEYILDGRRKTATSEVKQAIIKSEAELQPPSPQHLAAIQKLERSVSIWTPRKSNIIEVSCKAESPAIAQKIVATLIDVYLAEHVRVHNTPGSYEFFSDQAQVSLKQWKSAANKLREAKDRLGIVTIDGKRRELESQIADIDAKLIINQTELTAARAKIASLERLIEELPKTVVIQEMQGPNAAFDGMRQTLYSLEAREQDLSSKMQDNHPQLVAVREQVADLREILGEQPMQRIQATEAINPARQAQELALLGEQSNVDSLTGRGRELTVLQTRLQGQLKQLNGEEGNLLQLQQAVDLAESRHSEYAQRLEQARISRSLDEEQISSLNVVQPASYVAKATGPRRIVVLGLGLFLATFGGLGSALLAAYFNPIFLTAADLEQLLGLPLTGILPREPLLTAAA